MFHAINTLRNNKMYLSLKVFQDLSLQQTDNNRWICPDSEIENYGEFEKGTQIELSYIKETQKTKNGVSFSVSPHFRKHPKFKGVELKKPSKDHNLIVDLIYNLLLTEKIKDINIVTSEYYYNKSKEVFYYNKLIDLDLDITSINYEVTVESENNTKRADIFIMFNKVNEIYGKGICFEIQLSKQKTEITKDRTFHRALLGLSTIWIYRKDIINKDSVLIIPKTMVVFPYLNVLNTNLKESKTEIIKTYETQGILLDLKIDNFNKMIDKKVEEIIKKTKAENTICLKCEKGYMSIKEYQNKSFLGCSNYKECNKL